MIDHVSLRVSDLARALPLYKAALAPIGYSVIMEFPGFVGMGEPGKPDFWITQSDKAINPGHVAFSGDRAAVHAFHEAALRAGFSDNGAPGPRPDYGPTYYGAFVLDFDGNNVEVCSHVIEGAAKKKAPPRKPAAKPKARVKAAAKPKAKAGAKPKARAAAKPKAGGRAKGGKAKAGKAKPKSKSRR